MTTTTMTAVRTITAIVVSITLAALLSAIALGAHQHHNQSQAPNGTACVRADQLLHNKSVVHTSVCIPDVPLER